MLIIRSRSVISRLIIILIIRTRPDISRLIII